MSSEEELYEKITDLIEQVENAKAAKLPQEELDPLLRELDIAKEEYKNETGREYRPQSCCRKWCGRCSDALDDLLDD